MHYFGCILCPLFGEKESQSTHVYYQISYHGFVFPFHFFTFSTPVTFSQTLGQPLPIIGLLTWWLVMLGERPSIYRALTPALRGVISLVCGWELALLKCKLGLIGGLGTHSAFCAYVCKQLMQSPKILISKKRKSIIGPKLLVAVCMRSGLDAETCHAAEINWDIILVAKRRFEKTNKQTWNQKLSKVWKRGYCKQRRAIRFSPKWIIIKPLLNLCWWLRHFVTKLSCSSTAQILLFLDLDNSQYRV